MIIFSHVSKSFGPQKVLNDLSFQVKKGEIFMIVGPSGTGKSVTLSHIIGLMKPDAGEITISNIPLSTAGKRQLQAIRSKTGMLFQGGALLNWMNIYDNVALPLRENTRLSPEEIADRVNQALAMLELSGAAKKMPSEISGGMVKRAALARAAVCRPEIMLYDEPTSGLDPVMSRKIDSLIVRMREMCRVTSIVVTHDLVSALNIGDRIALFHGGKMLLCAPPEEFLQSRNPHVQEFIKAQFYTGKEEK